MTSYQCEKPDNYQCEKPDKVFHEMFLEKEVGCLRYFELERMHVAKLECPKYEEHGNPKYHHVITVKRDEFSLHAVSKTYETPKVKGDLDDVRAENDGAAQNHVNDNRYILKVYDFNIYCTIYEHYIFNLEEVCSFWKKRKIPREKLGSDVLACLEKKSMIKKGECTTVFFRDLMRYTLEFLEFLRCRKRSYCGLHPHNILIVDEECTIKFKGLKDISDADGLNQDVDDFIRLVRFCAHGGGRDINNVFNGSISKEAQDFLLIFDIAAKDNRKELYFRGFNENRVNISKHPLFWDASTCLNYFMQTHGLLTACNLTKKKFEKSSKMGMFQQNLNSRIRGISKDLQGVNVEPTNSTDPTEVVNGIIHGIRNIEGHFPDGLGGVLGNLGPLKGSHPRDFWKQLRSRFPGLIVGVHRVMISYTVELSPLFRDHWQKFYPSTY